jgi:uncharacterized protein
MFPFLIARASMLAFVTTVSRSAFTKPCGITRLYSSSAVVPQQQQPFTLQYILRYSYVPDVLEKRGPHREKHLALAKEMCQLGGPTAPVAVVAATDNAGTPATVVVPTGALFVFADSASAQAFVEQDPYVTAGIVTEHFIEEWTVAIRN